VAAEIQIPPVIRFGCGLLPEVAGIASRLRCTRPLIVTDRFMAEQGPPGQLADALQHAGLECAIFSDTVPDPTSDAIR
jgi:alcohol dehydrogenase